MTPYMHLNGCQYKQDKVGYVVLDAMSKHLKSIATVIKKDYTDKSGPDIDSTH